MAGAGVGVAAVAAAAGAGAVGAGLPAVVPSAPTPWQARVMVNHRLTRESQPREVRPSKNRSTR
jgi:hypothetical protein